MMFHQFFFDFLINFVALTLLDQINFMSDQLEDNTINEG